MTIKKIDVILLALFPIFSVTVSLIFKTNLLVSTLLFYGLPSLWLSFRTPHMIKKTLIFAAITSIPLGTIMDYIIAVDDSWFVPTVFSFRLFNIVPIEDLIWGFFLVYSVVIFYEHFLDKGKHELIDKRMKYLLWPLIIFLLFILLVLNKPDLLVVPYAYFWVGFILILLPSITFLSFFPRLLSKYIKTASYFFLVGLIQELTALQLNHWSFPGKNFIGWVELFGYRFPFEEFFFFLILLAISILSYYEFFDDDRR